MALDSQEKSGSYHFQVIARAIEIIDAAAPAQISLADLAGQLGMSDSHFQRLFSAWAGVSPKRYQQYLALNHAKLLLAERCSMLETADRVGLSGGGRLHDLFVRWEAMSPGDYARRGAGLALNWAWADTPFGPALAMASERGLCGLAFAAECGTEAAMADLTARWPEARYRENPDAVLPILDGILSGRRKQTEARLHLIGAPFQIKVWEALLDIPDGAVTTYSDIAAAIGHPKAVRAVGTAVGRNPVSWLIPCHRALRKGGGLGGYHWGLPVKRALLAREAARREAGVTTAA